MEPRSTAAIIIGATLAGSYPAIMAGESLLPFLRGDRGPMFVTVAIWIVSLIVAVVGMVTWLAALRTALDEDDETYKPAVVSLLCLLFVYGAVAEPTTSNWWSPWLLLLIAAIVPLAIAIKDFGAEAFLRLITANETAGKQSDNVRKIG